MSDARGKTSFDPIDVHVGRRVRLRRRWRGLSQAALARGIEVSFQQVQKYERGANRISASKLYRIAEVLRTPVGYFFEGLSESTPSAADGISANVDLATSLAVAGGPQLIEAFPSIRPALRRRLVALVQELVQPSDTNGAMG